jgi:hypothetical protein
LGIINKLLEGRGGKGGEGREVARKKDRKKFLKKFEKSSKKVPKKVRKKVRKKFEKKVLLSIRHWLSDNWTEAQQESGKVGGLNALICQSEASLMPQHINSDWTRFQAEKI